MSANSQYRPSRAVFQWPQRLSELLETILRTGCQTPIRALLRRPGLPARFRLIPESFPITGS